VTAPPPAACRGMRSRRGRLWTAAHGQKERRFNQNACPGGGRSNHGAQLGHRQRRRPATTWRPDEARHGRRQRVEPIGHRAPDSSSTAPKASFPSQRREEKPARDQRGEGTRAWPPRRPRRRRPCPQRRQAGKRGQTIPSTISRYEPGDSGAPPVPLATGVVVSRKATVFSMRRRERRGPALARVSPSRNVGIARPPRYRP